jgi:hypothetical protein
MAKAAASLAEARSHNVPPEVFLKHYREIRDLKDAQADAAAAVARAKKAAKNDGVDLDALKWLEKLAGLDTDEAELQIKHLQIYAKWIELPIGMQLDMWGKPEPATVDAQAAEEQREWAAGGDGYKAGEKGDQQREDNPHEAGSAEHVAWDKGWTRGHKVWLSAQKQIASEMGPKGAKKSTNGATPARKRGRPKASGEQAAIL